MYKVFIRNIPLILASKDELSTENQPLDFDALSEKPDFEELPGQGINSVVSHNLGSLWNAFSAQYKLIEAAGGKVYNPEGKVLFIYRLGKWDLPKGKIEKGEAIKEAAIREVEEECGITDLSIIRELPSTYHTYELKGKQILKRSYWFEMSTDFEGNLIPQLEENITKAEWLNERQIKAALQNSYEAIKELF